MEHELHANKVWMIAFKQYFFFNNCILYLVHLYKYVFSDGFDGVNLASCFELSEINFAKCTSSKNEKHLEILKFDIILHLGFLRFSYKFCLHQKVVSFLICQAASQIQIFRILIKEIRIILIRHLILIILLARILNYLLQIVAHYLLLFLIVVILGTITNLIIILNFILLLYGLLICQILVFL